MLYMRVSQQHTERTVDKLKVVKVKHQGDAGCVCHGQQVLEGKGVGCVVVFHGQACAARRAQARRIGRKALEGVLLAAIHAANVDVDSVVRRGDVIPHDIKNLR